MSSRQPFEEICTWPENGDNGNALDELMKVGSPYEHGEEGRPLAACYPGTPLDPEVAERMSRLSARQLNAIGTHTHGEMKEGRWEAPDGEGGFNGLGKIERDAVWMLASMLGGSRESVDGYFCGGGTEANLHGILLGRQWLRNYPDPFGRGIVVLATPLVHYSIIKAADITDIGRSQWTRCPECQKVHIFHGDRSGSGLALVGMNEQGEMDVGDLERVFRLKYEDGFRRFIIVPTAGTTVFGSVDPIEAVSQFAMMVPRTTNASVYVHVDAAFGAFTVPFINAEDKPKIGFDCPGVMSMACDADKMGHMPYPAGIFLCRKGLQALAARRVQYVRGNEDDTIPGSRTAVSPMLAYWFWRKIGVEGQRDYVNGCINTRNALADAIRAEFSETDVHILDHPRFTNFLPLEIKINKDSGDIPSGMLAAYELRDDFMPKDPLDVLSCPITVYKICVMPHHTQVWINRFVADLKSAFASVRR